MNSIPQQAVANGKGHSEFLRAQATISSSRVTRNSAPPPPAFGPGSEGSAPVLPTVLMASAILWKTAPPVEPRRSRRSAEIDRVRERLHVGHAIQVDEAVEVIDLVLEHAGVIARRLERD